MEINNQNEKRVKSLWGVDLRYWNKGEIFGLAAVCHRAPSATLFLSFSPEGMFSFPV